MSILNMVEEGVAQLVSLRMEVRAFLCLVVLTNASSKVEGSIPGTISYHEWWEWRSHSPAWRVLGCRRWTVTQERGNG